MEITSSKLFFVSVTIDECVYVYPDAYIYLVSPPDNPVIGPKFDENTYHPLNRYKGNAIPQQRTHGWMDAKVWEFETTTETVPMDPGKKDLNPWMLHSIMDSIMKEFEHLVIKLEEVKSATNNFTDTKIIGKGGFGNVYQGELSQSRGKTKAAFKRLDRKHGQGDPQFWKEVMMLSRYTHENLISLLGFCDEGGEKILVYEHASNGSLDRHLGSTTLTWSQRIRICHDAAKGLCYLHEDKGNHHRVLHRDIKSSNILLDENWKAKVSDMGLAKVGPTNQYTFLMTDIVGTLGYIDPMYLRMGFLTKESDVYSFGVVLFEVLCGRLCFDYSNAHAGNIVHIWKQRYKENKLDEIMYKDALMQALDQSSLEMFSKIAFQCLHKSREKRPKMSDVVQKLEIALKSQELLDLVPKEHQEIVKAVVPPLIYRSVEELNVLLSKGVLLNGGKTRWLSVNGMGEHIERIYIEACLNLAEIQASNLQDPSHYDIVNSRFPGGRCYDYQYDGLKACVRGQYLTPQISYTLNLVFRYKLQSDVNEYNLVRYKIDGEDETKVFIIYPSTHLREDGWFLVPLYQFTSQNTTADLRFEFETRPTKLLVAGIEFQPSEEKVNTLLSMVQLPVFEEYHSIIEAASQSLAYRSFEELKQILSVGIHLKDYKTWFSLNEKGEHCHMISIKDCLIPNEDFTPQYESQCWSRFPAGLYRTKKKGFKTHVKTELLSPLITYTVYLVFQEYSLHKNGYINFQYRLKGETTTSTLKPTEERNVDWFYITELFQFNSDGSIVDIEIDFEDHGTGIAVEGISFEPLEKLSRHIQWTTKKELYSILRRGFLFDYGQQWFVVDKHGKKCLMISARATWVIDDKNSAWDVLSLYFQASFLVQ
ncbi:kinase-like domain, phloem protein 2-like protein [Tanacetum coccineum]